MACDISAYNVQGYIHKLETLREYEFPFERLRRVEESYGGKQKTVKNKDGKDVRVDNEEEEEEEEEEKLEAIKEEEEGDDEERPTTASTKADTDGKESVIEEEKKEEEDNLAQEEKRKEEENEAMQREGKKILESLKKKPENALDLAEIDKAEARLEQLNLQSTLGASGEEQA